MCRWPVGVKLEVARRPRREGRAGTEPDHSGREPHDERKPSTRSTALEVLELLVDSAEKKISLFTSLSLGAALLLRGFIGSHLRVGRCDPEIDVADPAQHEGLLGFEEEAALPIEDDTFWIELPRHRRGQLERIDPVLGRRFAQSNDEGVESVRDPDCLGRRYAQDLVHDTPLTRSAMTPCGTS